jgi:predicted MPP superfamily phosphohydrolase
MCLEDVNEHRFALAGVPDDMFTLLLYHSPDLALHAAERGIDLYLGGHTHGAQRPAPAFYAARRS